jgi:hypothetical protein
MALALLLAACRPRFPLSEVPITGGTQEQRDLVRDELLDFEGWVGHDRVHLAEVRIEDIKEGYDGLWHAKKSLIRLDEEASNLRQTARHELCHALDTAEDLSSGRPLLKSLGQVYTSFDEDIDRKPRREAFAEVCDLGPLATTLAQSSTCADDNPELLQALGYTDEEVWTARPLPAARSPGEPMGGFDLGQLPEPVTGYLVLSTSDPGFLFFNLAFEEGGTQAQVDAVTGEMVFPTLEGGERAVEPPGGLTSFQYVLWRVGWPTGPGAAILLYSIPDHPPLWPRLAMHDGTQWRPVPQTCPWETGVGADVFTAQDRVWYAWDEGQIVHWAPLSD